MSEERRNVLFNNTLNTFLFTVIWHQTYGKILMKEKYNQTINTIEKLGAYKTEH